MVSCPLSALGSVVERLVDRELQPAVFAAFPDKHGAPQSSLRGQSYEKRPKYSALSADINRHLWPLCIPAGPEQWECARQYKPPFYLTLLVLFCFVLLTYLPKRNTGNKRRNLVFSFHWDWEFVLVSQGTRPGLFLQLAPRVLEGTPRAGVVGTYPQAHQFSAEGSHF